MGGLYREIEYLAQSKSTYSVACPKPIWYTGLVATQTLIVSHFQVAFEVFVQIKPQLPHVLNMIPQLLLFPLDSLQFLFHHLQIFAHFLLFIHQLLLLALGIHLLLLQGSYFLRIQ